MSIGSLSLKATLFSASIFWLIIIAFEDFHLDIFSFVMLSIIPIFLCCFLTIIVTIAPFFFFEKKGTTYIQIYKKYFPYYAITCFGLCFGFLMYLRFEWFATAFFTSAYFSLLQTWVWISKTENK